MSERYYESQTFSQGTDDDSDNTRRLDNGNTARVQGTGNSASDTRRLNGDQAEVVNVDEKVEVSCERCGTPGTPGMFCQQCGAKLPLKKTPPIVHTFQSLEVLHFGKLLASVVVKSAETDQVTVTIDGNEEMKAKVRFEERDSQALVTGDIPLDKRYRNPFNSGNGFNTANNQLYYQGYLVDVNKQLQISVVIPQKMNLIFGKTVGSISIEDGTDISLEAYLYGKSTLRAVSLKDFKLEISGVSDTIIGKVNGNVYVDVSGMGGIEIKSGKANAFSASISGMGNIRFLGTVIESAAAHVSGMGNIYIARSEVRVSKQRSGMGQIIVGYEPPVNSGSGGFSSDDY